MIVHSEIFGTVKRIDEQKILTIFYLFYLYLHDSREGVSREDRAPKKGKVMDLSVPVPLPKL